MNTSIKNKGNVEGAVALIEQESLPVVEEARGLVIGSKEEMTVGVDVLSRLNQFLDRIDQERSKVTVPLNEALKAERGRWKPLEVMYEDAVSVVKGKMMTYQTEAKKKEDADRARVVTGLNKGKIDVDKAVDKLSAIAENGVDKSVLGAGGAGSVTFKTVKKFKVVDIKKLPVAFVVANDVAIRKAMNEGVEVPGVKYWNEEVPINFR